jgi:hypothetical protein
MGRPLGFQDIGIRVRVDDPFDIYVVCLRISDPHGNALVCSLLGPNPDLYAL